MPKLHSNSNYKILDILFLCDYRPLDAATVTDHINAFYKYSNHNIYFFTDLVKNEGHFPEDLLLEKFDCIIVHYSLFLAIDAYISRRAKESIKRFKGLKAIFIQDEYRFVNKTVGYLKDLNFHLIFTCLNDDEVEKVYPVTKLPNLHKVNVLTGYIPEDLKIVKTIPLCKRRYDVGYRGRKYPYWHGRAGLEKWKIAEEFKKRTSNKKLKISISYREKDRIYGQNWVNFITNCKAMLGVESGCSVFDFTGQISAATETYVSLFKKDSIDYESVRKKFFYQYEDLIDLNQISPRCFEAVTLRTLMILYEGNYSGVLKPWRHYIPLKKDHSNIEEVLEVLKDEERVAKIITNAYLDIACNDKYSFPSFIRMVDEKLKERFNERMKRDVSSYNMKDFYKEWPFNYISYPHGLKKSKFQSIFIGIIKKIARQLSYITYKVRRKE